MNLCNNSSSGLLMGPNRTFQALVGPAAWNGVLKGTERRKLPAGRKLVGQGDVGAFVIVVISGVVRVDQIGVVPAPVSGCLPSGVAAISSGTSPCSVSACGRPR